MLKQACFLCKIVGVLVIIGALNWGLMGVLQKDLVAQLLGPMSTATRVVYSLVGLAGLMMLASYFINCPACNKK